MNCVDIKELPVRYKERIEKSCLILSKFRSKYTKGIKDFGIVTILSDSFRYKIESIYAVKDDFRIEEISKMEHRVKPVYMSDAVFDEMVESSRIDGVLKMMMVSSPK